MDKKILKLVLKFSFILIMFFTTIDSYSQAQFQNNKFVIILDVQQYWTEKTLSVDASKKMINAINKLIRVSNPGKVIYVKTSMVEKRLTITFKGFKVDTVYADAFDSTLFLVNNIIFEKTVGDAFSTPKLTEYLTQKQAKEIIITGLLAERCVYNTVLGGISRGYDIYIVPEAIGSKSAKRKRKVLFDLQKKGCQILNLQNM